MPALLAAAGSRAMQVVSANKKPFSSELGVFGVFLGDGQRTLLNEEAGHLLRVKLDGVDEGGVCAGFACLSSPALYP